MVPCARGAFKRKEMGAINNSFIGSRRIGIRMILVIATGMTVGLISTVAQARPQAKTTKYFDISLYELIEQYKSAHVAAGFYLASEEADPSGNYRSLLFKFKDPRYPGMTQGSIELAISLEPFSERDACAPCHVHIRNFGNFGDDYSPAHRYVAGERMMLAHSAARAQVSLKLGVPPAAPRVEPGKPKSIRPIRND